MNAAIIKLDAIRPRDGNRHVGGFDQEKLLQLIESVKEQGVLQPILVVDHETEQGEYYLVAGERRVRAAKAAGLTTIPAIIADPDHDEAWYELAAIAENVQRDGIHPLDESDGLHRLVELGLSAKETADRIGRSVDHVYGRLRLQKLSGTAREFFENGQCGVGGAGKLARLPEDQQDLVIKKMGNVYRSDAHVDDKAISQTIEGNTDELSKAPFDIHDATLLEGIEKLPKKVTHTGSCMDCPFRVDWDGQTYMFDDHGTYHEVPEQQDRCSNKTCWKAKTKAHVDQQRAKLEKSGEKFAIASGNPTSKKKDVWGAYDYSELHQPEGEPIPKGYQKVLIESGPQAGAVVIGKRHRTSSPGAGSRDWQKEQKEREEREERRKGLWSAVCDRIDIREAPKLLQEIDVYRELLLTVSSGYGPAQAMVKKLGIPQESTSDLAIERHIAKLKFGELRKLVAWALLAQNLIADVEDDNESDLLNRILRRYGITEPAPQEPPAPEPMPDPETVPQPPVAEEGTDEEEA